MHRIIFMQVNKMANEAGNFPTWFILDTRARVGDLRGMKLEEVTA